MKEIKSKPMRAFTLLAVLNSRLVDNTRKVGRSWTDVTGEVGRSWADVTFNLYNNNLLPRPDDDEIGLIMRSVFW